jgi:ATP-binding cassette, subfamily F, member 3
VANARAMSTPRHRVDTFRLRSRLRQGGQVSDTARCMLTISDLQKAYGGRTLFEEVSLQVNRGDRVGLVGPNGAGKTTLFRLLLGEEKADAGTIAMPRGTVVGYLPQESAPAGDETVLELASATVPEMTSLRRQLRESDAEADGDAMRAVRERFEEVDGHRVEARARQILAGLGFRERDHERPVRELSGGWVMRAHLGRLLVQEPDLLLLDEPTNHLDLDALLWFQGHLKGYPGGILLISHDRAFLNELVDAIIEIRQSRFVRYTGNYDAFLLQRAAAEEQRTAAWKNQQREIARLQRFVDRFRAKNTKATQAQSKLRQIERMDLIEAPSGAEAVVDFEFPQPARSGQRVIQLRDIHHAYGQNVVYAGMEFEAERGQRIVLVGPNGAGKSTLLKLLAGVVQPQSGEVRPGHNVRIGYFSQYRVDQLDSESTVLEEAYDTPQRLTETFVRGVLGTFLFRGDDVFKRVRVLSGGEKSRLALVKLLLDPPNLLLMDEPTNHLDIPSTEALLNALQRFEGTTIFISHDVYFIRQLANHVVHVRDGVLRHYPGGYDYYLDKKARDEALEAGAMPGPAETARTAKPADPDLDPSPAAANRARKRMEAEERQARSRSRRELRGKVDALEREISGLETEQAKLTAELEDPETYQTGRAAALNREFLALQNRLEQLHAEWERVATELTALDIPAPADSASRGAEPG